MIIGRTGVVLGESTSAVAGKVGGLCRGGSVDAGGDGGHRGGWGTFYRGRR